MPSAVMEPGHPCFKCGVNAWTSCKHRSAERVPPEPEKEKPNLFVVRAGGGSYKMTSRYTGNGYNFRRRKRVR